MTRTRVGVLRGGTSNEYNLSLKTGAAMLLALPEEKYEVRDILIDKQGRWHLRGMPADPMRALAQIDVALNALHGGIGEDGTVQRILERAGVPYTGSRAHSAALSLNKIRAREVLQQASVRMPHGIAFSLENALNTGDMAQAVFSQFGPPYIVKPSMDGASYGIRYVPTIVELPDAIGDTLDAFGDALVEEYVRGHEATVGLIEGFRKEPLYVLPPAQVHLPESHPFLHSDHHESASLRYSVPSSFTHDEKKSLAEMARAAHRALGLHHFSRADVILTRRGPVLLEVNAIPGLYEGSAFPHMLSAVGSSVREFLEHAIYLARSLVR
jgi:D-alanine-D-alanine ligase